MLRPLAVPFTTTGIVVIFLIFFLFQREDLRDRFIRLLGSEDLERTTAALDDAGQRLGKLFLTATHFECDVRRSHWTGPGRHRRPEFTALGAAGDDPSVRTLYRRDPGCRLANCAGGCGWKRLDHDVVDGRLVRGGGTADWKCRRATGVRDEAPAYRQSLWSSPRRSGPGFGDPWAFCSPLRSRCVLSSLPGTSTVSSSSTSCWETSRRLTPQQTAYQRMLTGDPIEAIEQARAFLKEGTIGAYYEEILLGALRLAEADAALGRLDDARLENIHETVSEIH